MAEMEDEKPPWQLPKYRFTVLVWGGQGGTAGGRGRGNGVGKWVSWFICLGKWCGVERWGCGVSMDKEGVIWGKKRRRREGGTGIANKHSNILQLLKIPENNNLKL